MSMTLEQKIRKTMTDYIPSEATITHGCMTYTSTRQTHESYKQQLIHADKESEVYQTYLSRCAEWIKILRLHNQIFTPIFEDDGN